MALGHSSTDITHLGTILRDACRRVLPPRRLDPEPAMGLASHENVPPCDRLSVRPSSPAACTRTAPASGTKAGDPSAFAEDHLVLID